ncbi:MAG: hypothetical protein BWY69_01617 [Planctomycetes bacterium ADurb.Bin401]|nr:MAG: hypothetical protein BWY69_01617 [Planctomycetes bacterium ADurb.Bin401]
MKRLFLFGLFVFSLFICGCGNESRVDCHHYTGSDYWDDPLYNCNGIQRNANLDDENREAVERNSYDENAVYR